jgi:hypothetical protein
MTVRSTMEIGRNAPKISRLELHRETLKELTEGEVETVAGGQVFVPRPTDRYSCRCVRSVELRCSVRRTMCPPSI